MKPRQEHRTRKAARHKAPRLAAPRASAGACARAVPVPQSLLSAEELTALMAVAAGEDPALTWQR